MERIKKLIFYLALVGLVSTPLSALADGMIMPPEHYWMYETSQEAVILYDEGIETMVVSVGFQGDAEDFAWVIPVPNRPEVTKGSEELFISLEQLTGSRYYRSLPMHSLDTQAIGAAEGVTVVETKQIDYYDVTVLSSTNKDALVDWLNEHEYAFPESASYILNSYIENGWYYVAMRINPESLDWVDVGQKLRQGRATPVMLTFAADNIVYPMKISSIFSEPDRTAPISYTGGVSGQAVSVTRHDQLSFEGTNFFNSAAGTVELWVQPGSDWETEGGYWELLNVVDASGKDVFELRRATTYGASDEYDDGLQFIAYKSNGGFQSWRMPEGTKLNWDQEKWYHIAATWSLDQSPVLYINGTGYELEAAYSSTTWTPREVTRGTLHLGQRGVDQGGSALRGKLDEVQITNAYSSADAIQSSYQRVLEGEAPVVPDGALFAASFDNNLTETVSGETISYAYNTYEYTIPERIAVELYIFADHKKTLPGFSTKWANWVEHDIIREMALTDQGTPWIDPPSDKYFLTKMTRHMQTSEMTDDLFPRDAENNDKVGVGPSGWDRFKQYIGPILLYGFIYFIVIVIASIFSPWGMLFLVGALLQFLSRNRTIHIVFWVLQSMAIAGYVLMIAVLLFVPIFHGQSMWEALDDLPMYDLSTSTRQVIGFFILMLPIIVVLSTMTIVMIWQRRYQKKPRQYQRTAIPTPLKPATPDQKNKQAPQNAKKKPRRRPRLKTDNKSYGHTKKNSQPSRKKQNKA